MRKKIIVLCCILFLTGCGCTKKTDNTKKAKSSNEIRYKSVERIGTKVVDGLTFSKPTMTTLNGRTEFLVSVTNKGKEEYKLDHINVKILNKNGFVIEELYSYIGEKIKPNETKKLNSSTDKDLKYVGIVEYEIIK